MKTKLKYVVLILFITAVIVCVDGSKAFADSPSIRLTTESDFNSGSRQDVDWFVTTDILSRQPHWDGFSSEAPLSANKAVTIALSEVKQHYADIQNWEVKTIQLSNMSGDQRFNNLTNCSNVWWYEIEVKPKDHEKYLALWDSGNLIKMYQVVLLDGTLVKPIKRKTEQ